MNGARINRWWGVGTAVLGGATLAAPGALASLLASPTPPPLPVVRALALRDLVQGFVLLGRPRAGVAAAFAAVDALHAATMVVAVIWLPRHRTAAVVSGSVAVVSSAIGTLAAVGLGKLRGSGQPAAFAGG